jgi:hypothetical protein
MLREARWFRQSSPPQGLSSTSLEPIAESAGLECLELREVTGREGGFRLARRRKFHKFNRGWERATGAAGENPGPVSR